MKMFDFNHIFWDRGSMFFPQFLSWTNEYIPIYQYKRSNKPVCNYMCIFETRKSSLGALYRLIFSSKIKVTLNII